MKCIVTNRASARYWDEIEAKMEKSGECCNLLQVYPEIRKQEIRGFGGAFTEASGYNFSKLGAANKERVLEAYFGERGLRYRIGRLHINSCDFALGNYTYVEEGDDALCTFDIGRDREYVTPFVKAAMAKSHETPEFLASPWSPPAFMKTTGRMNQGGALKREYYQAWADYFVKYIRAYAKEGIPIGSVTVQNEPMAASKWDSCVYTAKEEGVFLRDYLYPTLQKAGLTQVKIFVWDHNKEEVYRRAGKLFSDPQTRKCAEGVAAHWYTGDHFEALEAVKDAYPEKHIIFTEGCVEYSRFSAYDEVAKAEMYAHDMIGNLRAQAEAVIDWNLLLDEEGGPNHVGNFCAAPVMCNLQDDCVKETLAYYYIGHFSRYIRKGARQIGVSRYTDRVEAAAFVNPDGGRVVVLLNRNADQVEVIVREGDAGFRMVLEGHSIVTCIYGAEEAEHVR